MNELEQLSRVASDTGLRDWLTKRKNTSLTCLATATDLALMHRAQGEYGLVEKLLELLDKAKNSR